MQGKILSVGIIGANDGKRYNFEVEDIKNLNGRNVGKLEGCEVDFNIEENQAKEIFITKDSLNFFNFATGVQSIKLKGYIAVCCQLLVKIPIPFVSQVFALIGFVCELLAIISINKVAQSKTLVRNFVIWTLIAFVGIMFFLISGGIGVLANFMDSKSFPLTGFIVGYFVLVPIMIVAWYFLLRYKRELAFITKQKVFLWSAYAKLLSIFTILLPPISLIFSVIAFVLDIFGWIRFQEIQKRSEGDKMPWF